VWFSNIKRFEAVTQFLLGGSEENLRSCCPLASLPVYHEPIIALFGSVAKQRATVALGIECNYNSFYSIHAAIEAILIHLLVRSNNAKLSKLCLILTQGCQIYDLEMREMHLGEK